MNKLSTAFLTLLAVASLPTPMSADYTYSPLSGDLPGSLGTDWTSLGEVLQAILQISVVIAAILAVIMLAIGGFKYMTSESVFKTQGAKEQIANAVIGLLIVLAAILILVTINPNLQSFGVFA